MTTIHDRNITATNTGFASGGVTCKLEALSFYSVSVLVDRTVLRNRQQKRTENSFEVIF
jgi:hypothetical protein